MYRYLLFISGLYGQPLRGAYINFCIELFLELEPESASVLSIPEDYTKETFFGFIYDDRNSFVAGLINSILNKHVDTVLCFDNERCDLYIYKGDGDPETIVSNKLGEIQQFYGINLDAEFGYINIFDRRTV